MDYQTIADASVVFQPGETTKSFSFAITDDSIVEQDEDLVVEIASATSAIVGSPSQATVTIQSEDRKYVCVLSF